jgi:hypothetical protein
MEILKYNYLYKLPVNSGEIGKIATFWPKSEGFSVRIYLLSQYGFGAPKSIGAFGPII